MVSKSSDFATAEKKIQWANKVNLFFLQQKNQSKNSPAPSKILLPSLHESICPFIPHVGNKISPCYPAAWWPRPAGCTRGSLSATPGDGKKAQNSEGIQNRDDKNKSSMYRGNGQAREVGLDIRSGNRGDGWSHREWELEQDKKIHLFFAGCGSSCLPLLPQIPSSTINPIYSSTCIYLTSSSWSHPLVLGLFKKPLIALFKVVCMNCGNITKLSLSIFEAQVYFPGCECKNTAKR